MQREERTFVVDRIEGELAVLVPDEGGKHIEIPVRFLPVGIGEGAVIAVNAGAEGAMNWGAAKRDRAAEAARRAELAKRVDRLRSSDPGGDLVL